MLMLMISEKSFNFKLSSSIINNLLNSISPPTVNEKNIIKGDDEERFLELSYHSQ